MSNLKVLKAASRTKNIRYAVRDVVVLANEVAKQGKKMLYLNIGDPNLFDFETPDHVIESINQALKSNRNGYAPSSGINEAREAIEGEAERLGIRNIQDIFVTTGASEAIDICLTALVNPGENVLTPSPGYPLYTAVLSKLDAVENPYYLDESAGWQPDVDDIASKINDKTKCIVLINPNNPTGSVCSKETLQKVIDIALERQIVIFADEIYDKLLLNDNEHVSIASLNHEVPIITFNGLSKCYVGPGLRIGWGVVSGNKAVLSDYIEAINKILRSRLSANHPIQYAIKPALEGDHAFLEIVKQKLIRRRDMTVSMLNDIPGISCMPPMGAFYAFPRLHTDKSDSDFVKGLIKEHGVVTVPGSGFGQIPGTRHIRVVFLPPEEVLKEAYEKIGDYYEKFAK
ncbi:MAG: aminotransferase [Candidatus Cloacimonetes bacterium 4572_55]|nr:MAG: aminotransferase [Candidatus Cloacimonetes bacterium 4572_55]